MKKVLVLSLLVVMVVAFSGCDWLQKEGVEEQVESSDVSMEDLVTYENEEYGFIFEHPGKWGEGWKGFMLEEVRENNKNGRVFDYGLTKDKMQVFNVNVLDKSKEEAVELNNYFGEINISPIMHNNIYWYKLDGGYYGYIAEINNLTFVVYHANYFSDKQEEGIEIFEEILKDFKINY